MKEHGSPGVLRIAVAGAGAIGRRHIELIRARAREVGDCSLAAIIDPVPAAALIAQAADVPHYPDLHALFAAQHPDGVILATPNPLHVGQTLQCVAAGAPVLLEKPVAHTVSAGEQLLAALRGSTVPVLVGHHRAHSPIMTHAAALIAAGRLGPLVAVSGSAMFHKPDEYFTSAPWRSQPGGGPILINMVHEVHNLRMLCGEIIAVQAMAGSTARGLAVEDTVSISLRFANGVLGSFALSDCAASARSWEQTSGENRDYAHDASEDCYVVAGRDGSLAIPSMRIKRYASPQQRSWFQPFVEEQVEVERADPLDCQLGHFCAVMRGQAQPLVTVEDGLRNLRVTEAIATAAKGGQTVTLEG